MRDWDEVLSVATGLPDVVIGPYYGTPCPKVNGKAFAAPGREAGSFCVFSTTDEKPVLMATDPDTFWETAHYRNYPAVLARYGTDAHDRLVRLIGRAWWDRATKIQRERYGDRP